MKKRLLTLICALAGSGFGNDIYLPIEKGSLEVQAGYGYEWITGGYADDGEYVSWDEIGFFPEGYRPAAHAVPFQLKYGVGKNVDLRGAWAWGWANEDAGGGEGTSQPELGIKYRVPDTRMALYADLRLPIALGDVDTDDLSTILEVGALFRERFKSFRFTGYAGFHTDFEGMGGAHLLVQPEVFVHRDVGAYLGLEVVTISENGEDGRLVSLKPGIHADISRVLKADVSVSAPVSGESSPALWVWHAKVYVTLKP